MAARRGDSPDSAGLRTPDAAGGWVPSLLMEPDRMAARELASACLDEVTELTDQLIAAIFTDGPAWTDYRPVPEEDLRDGCHRYLSRVLRLLAGEVPMTEDDDVAADIGRHRAAQGVPLEVMLRTFRLGGRVVWEAMLKRADTARPEVIGAAATAMWTVVDGLSSALSSAYRQAQLEQLRRDEQHRHALIEDVLADRARNAGFGRRVAEQLDLPVEGAYLVVVADLPADGEPSLPSPRTALAAWRINSVWHARSDTLVGLIPLEGRDAGFVLDRLRRLARGRIAAATTDGGLAEVGVAHRLAAVTLSTLSALPTLGTLPTQTDLPTVVTVDERYPECLLASAPELRARLVTTRLGPILALPDRERDQLLRTLAAWLEADRSAGLAAERLYCHRNTVLNRLHRITTLLGRPLTGRQMFVELSLALSAVELSDQLGQSAQ